MERFTPEPWRYSAPDGIVETESGKPLASVIPTGVPRQRSANGILIAAAPELLSALRAMVRDFAAKMDDNERETLQRAADVIAKAEGRDEHYS